MIWEQRTKSTPPLGDSDRAELVRILRNIVARHGPGDLGDAWRQAMDYMSPRMPGWVVKFPRDAMMALTAGKKRAGVSPHAQVVAMCLVAAEPDYNPHWWLWMLPATLHAVGSGAPSELLAWASANKVDMRLPWRRGKVE